MSEASAKQLIERYLAALNAGDHEAMLACLADDVVHDLAEGGREIGKDKFRWALGLEARHFRETVSDIAILTGEGGGRAAAEVTVRGTYIATRPGLPAADGQSYSLLAGIFFEIDDGVFSRVTEYRDLDGWKAQLAKR